MNGSFELFAFYANKSYIEELNKSKVDGIIIDWERKGKNFRQKLYNTQVNLHNADDLKEARSLTSSKIICRLNCQAKIDIKEVRSAIDLGADELLLPMVTSCQEVEEILNLVNGQTKVGIMLETTESLTSLDEMSELPLSRFFVGLNDLSIQRGSHSLFTPLIDGTFATISQKIKGEFGFAGLTHPDEGHPIPCKVLINEMKRFGSTFGILRRSFYKDLDKYSMADIVNELRANFSLPFDEQLGADDDSRLLLADSQLI